jgi:hypothetical protein
MFTSSTSTEHHQMKRLCSTPCFDGQNHHIPLAEKKPAIQARGRRPGVQVLQDSGMPNALARWTRSQHSASGKGGRTGRCNARRPHSSPARLHSGRAAPRRRRGATLRTLSRAQIEPRPHHTRKQAHEGPPHQPPPPHPPARLHHRSIAAEHAGADEDGASATHASTTKSLPRS